MTVTPRGQRLLGLLTIIGIGLVSFGGLLLADRIGEAHRCSRLGTSPAAARYGCPTSPVGSPRGEAELPTGTASVLPVQVPRATPSAASRSRSLGAPKARVRVVTGSSLNWNALFECESGNDPRAVSPSGKYRGLAQFDMQTWRSVGGTGDPIDASRAEQTYRAQRLYKERGRSPWPQCGWRL